MYGNEFEGENQQFGEHKFNDQQEAKTVCVMITK